MMILHNLSVFRIRAAVISRISITVLLVDSLDILKSMVESQVPVSSLCNCISVDGTFSLNMRQQKQEAFERESC